MAAVAISPGRKGTARLVEVPRPEPGPNQVLVRVLQVGIDGTDRELHQGLYGEAPDGADQLIIGHESLGRIVETGAEVERFQPGDLVVATVRRPCAGNCPNCARGHFDSCGTGNYRERGIRALDGYLAEYYVEDPRFLIGIPPELAHVAVLIEPLSIVEKLLAQSFAIQLRLEWEPRRVLVLGAGCIGLLATAVLRLLGFETCALDRVEESHLKACLARRTGAAYLRSDGSLRVAAGQFDFITEATGFGEFTFQAIPLLAINGVLAICGVSGGNRQMQIPCDTLNMEMVLGNRVVFGCVNSSATHFRDAAGHLRDIEGRWPGLLGSMITRRLGFAGFAEALDPEPPSGIKTVIDLCEPSY